MKKILFLLSMLSIGSISAGITVINDTDKPNGILWRTALGDAFYRLSKDETIKIEVAKIVQIEKQRKGKSNLWLSVNPNQQTVFISATIAKHNEISRKAYQRKKVRQADRKTNFK